MEMLPYREFPDFILPEWCFFFFFWLLFSAYKNWMKPHVARRYYPLAHGGLLMRGLRIWVIQINDFSDLLCFLYTENR